ncbi:MAG: YybH family protein [Actinomycetota bacterium]|jgi:ketosteroid isomerase-like protein
MDAAGAVWTAFLELDDAFAAGDVDAVLEGFTDDPDLTLWRSAEAEHAIGPQELRSFATWMAGLAGSFTIDYTEHRVTVEGPVAWVNAAGTATWDDGAGEVKHMPHRVTAVFRLVGGRWRCHTRNGSQPRVVKLS